MPIEMPADSVQMQLVRRYSRLLREKQAEYRGPRIGAKERRQAAKEAAREAAGGAVERVAGAIKGTDAPAT